MTPDGTSLRESRFSPASKAAASNKSLTEEQNLYIICDMEPGS